MRRSQHSATILRRRAGHAEAFGRRRLPLELGLASVLAFAHRTTASRPQERRKCQGKVLHRGSAPALGCHRLPESTAAMLDHEFRSRHGAGAAKKRQSQMYDGQLKPARGAIETGAAGCWLPDSRREAGTIGAARPMALCKCSGMARLQCRQPPSHDHQGSDRIGHARRDTHDEAGKRLVLQASEAADSAAPGRDRPAGEQR
jgi:hypothetical protein